MDTLDTNETQHQHTHEAAPVVISFDTGPEKKNNPNTVILDEPIQRGNTTITEVTVRMPNAGELRGTSLQALSELDVVALQKILPRITTPTITAPDVAKMLPADLMQLGVKVAVFLLPKADREMVSPSE